LGRVTQVYLGEENYIPAPDDLNVLFLGVIGIPAEVIQLFRQKGCIRIYSGLMYGDYFVLPYQVACSTDYGIILQVRGDELLMF
jgi:hypothetical protein